MSIEAGALRALLVSAATECADSGCPVAALADTVGSAKASSARAFVTCCLMSCGAFFAAPCFESKANLLPESCNKENSSRAGNLAEISSTLALSFTESFPASSILKGSPVLFLKGEGDGFGIFDFASNVVGLPRLIGTISGRLCFSTTTGALKAPATSGGVFTSSSVEGRC